MSRRLITELVVTAIASPLFLLLLIPVHAYGVVLFLSWPLLYLGGKVAGWINAEFPPQGGGWFEGLGTVMIVDVILVSIEIWIILMVVVILVDRFILRRRNA